MVSVRCVRVPKRDGEKVRAELFDKGLLDRDFRIASDGDSLLIPVMPAYEGDTVGVELERQEHRETDYRVLADVPDSLKDILPNSFDIIGDVLIVKLEEPLLPYKKEIGEALISVTPNIRAVMLDSGVKGDFRIRDLEPIAGSGGSETVHREMGVRIAVDPAKVYFNPRLATERERVSSLVRDGEIVIDMFGGVAPFGTVICKRAHPKAVYSIDLNPKAEHFARRNAEMNHLDNLFPLTGDASEVITDLPDADRIIMNLPQMADSFLEFALAKLKEGGTVHLHRILERSDLDEFIEGLHDEFGVKVWEVSELKTYSPTMSVYVFDIRK